MKSFNRFWLINIMLIVMLTPLSAFGYDIRYDTNRDGVNDPDDLNFIIYVFMQWVPSTGTADVDNTGIVDVEDFYQVSDYLIIYGGWNVSIDDLVDRYLERYYSFMYSDVTSYEPYYFYIDTSKRSFQISASESSFYALTILAVSELVPKREDKEKWIERLSWHDVNADGKVDAWDLCISDMIYRHYNWDVPLPILSTNSVTLNAGERTTLIASGMEPGITYKVSSSDTSVATVAVSGNNIIITGNSNGGATITVEINSEYYTSIPSTCVVNVKGGQVVSGDVDGNGAVDVDDMNVVINVMLHKAEATPAADVNGDGNVDIDDMNAIINIMLHKE